MIVFVHTAQLRKRIPGLGPVAKGIKLPIVRQKLGGKLKVISEPRSIAEA